MYISRCHVHTQNEPMFVAGSMGLVSKLPLMLLFYKYSSIWIGGGNRLRYRSSTWRSVFIIVILYWLFPKSFPLCVHFPPQLLGIHLCCLCDLHFLEFLLVRTGFDMGPVDKNCLRVHHPVVQGLIQNMFENLLRQFFRKTPAECIAHRCKMRYLLQQSIS